MKDRILNFLESEHISPAEFADKIGVQRSSMSHILNGRNQPSAAFIQKMLHAFPSVNPRWLLIGEGEMNLANSKLVSHSTVTKGQDGQLSESDLITKKSIVSEPYSIENEVPDQSTSSQENLITTTFQDLPEIQEKDNSINGKFEGPGDEKPADNRHNKSIPDGFTNSGEKEIEQILFFYRDKTFQIYKPS